jgi:hypothetical protein
MPGLRLGLQDFKILVDGHVQLEEGIGSASLLLVEHYALRALSHPRTTTRTLSAWCSSTFVENRVDSIVTCSDTQFPILLGAGVSPSDTPPMALFRE